MTEGTRRDADHHTAMSAKILTFPDCRRTIRRLPLPPDWWAIEQFELRWNTPDEEFELIRNAARMGALMLPCPHFTCAARIGEECQSESGRRLRDPHMARNRTWRNLTLDDRAKLAAAIIMNEGR